MLDDKSGRAQEFASIYIGKSGLGFELGCGPPIADKFLTALQSLKAWRNQYEEIARVQTMLEGSSLRSRINNSKVPHLQLLVKAASVLRVVKAMKAAEEAALASSSGKEDKKIALARIVVAVVAVVVVIVVVVAVCAAVVLVLLIITLFSSYS